MGAKLNQLVAILNGNTGRKAVCQKAVTAVYQTLQKPALFSGLARVYKPKDDEGERFPPENKPVTANVYDLLQQARASWTSLFDTVATQDAANTEARADVKVDDVTIVAAVPVTHLMFLEKQLTDIHTALQAIPTLADEREWVWNANANCYTAPAEESAKIKKIEKPIVLYEATKEHPAQVKITTEDIVTGYWSTTHQSGALPKERKAALLARVLKLLDGVRKAREQANELLVTDVKYGDAIFDYVLNDTLPSTAAKS
jgi:hypothetical protein